LALIALAACGGGDGLPREPVSGSITVDDEPLPLGSITFNPLSDQGVQSGGVISAGKYAIPREQGPTPGKYRVQISSASTGAFSADQEARWGLPAQVSSPPPKRRDRIPPEYNAASPVEVEVKAGAENASPFAIARKKAARK